MKIIKSYKSCSDVFRRVTSPHMILIVLIFNNLHLSTFRFVRTQTEAKVVPNPNNGKFKLELNNLDIKTITILNSNGVSVWQGNSSFIELQNLTYGMYFAKITTLNENFIIKKFIIQN